MLTVMHKTESYNGGVSAEGTNLHPLGALSVLVVHAVICVSAVAPL